MKETVIPITIGALGTVQKVGKKTGGFGNKRKNRDHPDNGVIEIIYNTQKDPKDQRRLAVT